MSLYLRSVFGHLLQFTVAMRATRMKYVTKSYKTNSQKGQRPFLCPSWVCTWSVDNVVYLSLIMLEDLFFWGERVGRGALV